MSRFLESPARRDRVRDAAELAQEALYYLTGTSLGKSPPLDAQSALRLLRTFQLRLEPASKIAERIERQLSELTEDLAIDTLLDCLRGAISRHAEGSASERVFRPGQLLAEFEVLQRLMTVDQKDAQLWRDLRSWSRTSRSGSEDGDVSLGYVDWRRVQPSVSSALDIECPTALLGRGGLGKSTTLQHFLDELSASHEGSSRVLLLDAVQLASCAASGVSSTGDVHSSDLARLTGALALGAFATKTNGEQLVIAVDAIEALDDRGSILSVLSSLLAAVGRGAQVVVTCRATTWNELRSSQPAVRGWRVIELVDWPVEVVAEVVQASCSEPLQQPSLLELLRTPLFLDLFLRVARGGIGANPRTSSRLDLLTAYWQTRILPSGDARSLSRAELLREVSERTMEGIEHHRLPTTASSAAALRELASEGLFTISGGGFHFRHALLRDFALAQSVAETASPLHVVCTIQSHFIRLGALDFWLEGEVSVKGGVARLRSELERLEPGALMDVASSLGQLGNAGGVGLLELTTGMQPESAQELMAHATRWARLAGNGSWLIALATLPAHAAWAERTTWLDGELIQQLLDLVEAATTNDLAPAATRGLAEAIREWLDAPKFGPALTDHGGWLQGHAISIIGRAAPTNDTLRWFIRRGKLAGAARTMITGALPEMVARARDRLSPALLGEACLVGAGLRWSGRRLEWVDTDRQDWRGLRPYLLGEGMRWPGWLEINPKEFVPVAVALLAGLELNELEDFGKRREPEIEAFLAELEETSPSAEPSAMELAARELASGCRTPDGDETDVVPQLMPRMWQASPLGPLGLIEWFRDRASSSLSGDGRFFDDVLWPAVRDGASLACRIAMLEVLAPYQGPSPRPEALTTLLMQPALYRCPDAHPHLQRALRLQWQAISSNVRPQLLDCIMFSARRHGFETPDVYAPGPLLAALPEQTRPEQLKPYLELYREAALSLELEARRPVTSRPSAPLRPRTPRVQGLAPPARESWKRLLALPDATIRSSTPEHQSLTLAALRAVLSNLPAARDLVKVEGGARRLHDVVDHLVDERVPDAWPLTTTEIEDLLSWSLDGLEAFSEQELGEGCSALEGGTAQLPPKALVWVLLASMADTLLRAFPVDAAGHGKFFELLNERLKSPPDSIAVWIFFHVDGWFRAAGSGKTLLKRLLGDRVRNGTALWMGVTHIGGLDRTEQQTLLNTWLCTDLKPPLLAPDDLLRQLGEFAGGDALIPYEDGTSKASHDVLVELLERRPAVGLLSDGELHSAFLNHCVFGAKQAVVAGAVPTSSCWLYADLMTRAWRTLAGVTSNGQALRPMLWIFLPLFDSTDSRRGFRPSPHEWRQWWVALLPLAQAVLETGDAQDAHCVLKPLAEPVAREHLTPTELLELIEIFRRRSRALAREDLRVTQWWYQTFEAACEVVEGLSTRDPGQHDYNAILDIVREWSTPPLSLPRAAEALHFVRTSVPR